MRIQENDTDIKIPNWYLKLPQKVLDFISDAGIFLNGIIVRKKKSSKTVNTHTQFYL